MTYGAHVASIGQRIDRFVSYAWAVGVKGVAWLTAGVLATALSAVLAHFVSGFPGWLWPLMGALTLVVGPYNLHREREAIRAKAQRRRKKAVAVRNAHAVELASLRRVVVELGAQNQGLRDRLDAFRDRGGDWGDTKVFVADLGAPPALGPGTSVPVDNAPDAPG